MGAIEPWVLMNPEIAGALSRIGVRGTQDLELRRVGTRKSWEGLTRSFEVPMNSDYTPVLDQNAARTFFLRTDAHALTTFQKTPFPAVEMLSRVPRSRGVTTVTSAVTFESSGRGVEAMYLRDVLQGGIDANEMRVVKSDELHQDALAVSRWLRECGAVPFASLVRMLQGTLADVSVDEANGIFRALESNRCAASFSPFERRWLGLLHAVGRRDAAAMRAGALDALSRPEELSPQALHYAVAAGMLGSVAVDDLAGAREIWERSGGSIRAEDSLLLRILVARSGARR